jgi:hypothetical protein
MNCQRMFPRAFVLLICGWVALLSSGRVQAGPSEPAAKPVLYYIPHTHWDAALWHPGRRSSPQSGQLL